MTLTEAIFYFFKTSGRTRESGQCASCSTLRVAKTPRAAPRSLLLLLLPPRPLLLLLHPLHQSNETHNIAKWHKMWPHVEMGPHGTTYIDAWAILFTVCANTHLHHKKAGVSTTSNLKVQISARVQMCEADMSHVKCEILKP
jgi:hypothetical protein